MKTQYYAASSLDGYIATTQNSLDWLLQFGDVEGTSYPAFIREVGAIAMGSTTYEWILRHQVHVDPAKNDREGQAPAAPVPVCVLSCTSLTHAIDIHS